MPVADDQHRTPGEGDAERIEAAESAGQQPSEPAEPADAGGENDSSETPKKDQPMSSPVIKPLPTAEEQPAIGPKILGIAEEKPVPIVKKRLRDKPKREPLPWPELRAAVAAVRDELDVAELKEIFRLFPAKVRDQVIEGVREYRKGARRPVSQHAAKQLARAAHTARRMKRNAPPSVEVGEALGHAIAAELIASLEPDRAAEIILPRRDLLERESRAAQRRKREEEERRREEQRRRRRESSRSGRAVTSFGTFSGAKIKGLEEIVALFKQEAGEEPAPAEAEQQAPTGEAEAPTAAPQEAPAPAEPAAEPDRPAEAADDQPQAEAGAEAPADEAAPEAEAADADAQSGNEDS